MRRPLSHWVDGPRALMAIAVIVPGALAVLPVGKRMVMFAAPVHFWVVAATAGLTAVASLALTLAGARGRDGRAVLLGPAFSTMTALFAVHGMATPGGLVGPNGVIAPAGGLSIPVGALLLSLTALPV